MNEVIETLSNAFKELRSDRGGREYYIRSEECESAEREMDIAEQAFEECRDRLAETDQETLSSYLDAMARYHFEEEQRAYSQGMADAALLMDGLGLLRHGTRATDILERIRK